MNKSDLIKEVAKATGATQVEVTKIVNATIVAISSSLKKGDAVSISDFGTFKKVEKAARKGFNPSTKQPITIAAKTVAKFTPYKNIFDIK